MSVLGDTLRKAVEREVTEGLKKAVASPTIPVDAGAIKPVTDIVTQKVEPIIDHLTNQEPWYQSRVTWGSIIAIAAPILAPLLSRVLDATVTIDASEQAAIADWLTLVGSAAGGLFALYGRWRAKKPLGA